jgi:hypothetical protein
MLILLLLEKKYDIRLLLLHRLYLVVHHLHHLPLLNNLHQIYLEVKPTYLIYVP